MGPIPMDWVQPTRTHQLTQRHTSSSSSLSHALQFPLHTRFLWRPWSPPPPPNYPGQLRLRRCRIRAQQHRCSILYTPHGVDLSFRHRGARAHPSPRLGFRCHAAGSRRCHSPTMMPTKRADRKSVV